MKGSCAAVRAADEAGWRGVRDRLQVARHGGEALDALVRQALGKHAGRWTTDLTDAVSLVPQSFNFSVGRRDGVCWAWAQPNDDWEPGELQARHDHPGGSGLVVAHTPELAVTCAAVILFGLQDGGDGPITG
jgi:hypothetical protein